MSHEYDKELVREIGVESGSKSVKSSINFLRTVKFYLERNGRTFITEIVDNNAFFGGHICKDHFRLYEIAARKDCQGKGYGNFMLYRIRKICHEHGLKKITFRANKGEDAVRWYLNHGAVVKGQKEDDYEMEITV